MSSGFWIIIEKKTRQTPAGDQEKAVSAIDQFKVFELRYIRGNNDTEGYLAKQSELDKVKASTYGSWGKMKRSVGIANHPIEIAQPRQTPTANFVKPIIKTPTLNLYPLLIM